MSIIILKIIKGYQKTVTPISGMILGSHAGCRFYPTCSNYTYQAVKKFGIPKGLFKGTLRILRCNPLSKGGVDLI